MRHERLAERQAVERQRADGQGHVGPSSDEQELVGSMLCGALGGGKVRKSLRLLCIMPRSVLEPAPCIHDRKMSILVSLAPIQLKSKVDAPKMH
jgi:hypothetical protein